MSFDDGFILGLSLGGGGSGGIVGKLKAVIDDGAVNLSVILTDGSALTEYPYTYIAKTITASVTTSVTSDDTSTTNTKSWSKYLIDKLYDVSGEIVAQAVYSDEAKGIVSHYLDGSGNIIYIDSGYTAEGLETGAAVIGADVNAVAIAYAIARNQESASALQELKKAYREGMLDGDNGNDDVTEPTDKDTLPFDIITDGDDDGKSSTDPAATDMTNGGWYLHFVDSTTGESTGSIRIWIQPYHQKEDWGHGVYAEYFNKIMATVTMADGTTYDQWMDNTCMHEIRTAYNTDKSVIKITPYVNGIYICDYQADRSPELQYKFVSFYKTPPGVFAGATNYQK